MKKHAGGGGGEGGVNLGIIITPMLDMSFQILAFFIMTYHPSSLEGHIDGNLLPPSLVATKGPPKASDPLEVEPLPVDKEPDLGDVMTVIVKAVAKGQVEGGRNEGEPSRIMLRKPEAPAPLTIADTDVTFDKGLDQLKAELEKSAKDGGKANIKIEADGELRHQYTMRVYDACKKAGFQNVGFIAPAPVRK